MFIQNARNSLQGLATGIGHCFELSGIINVVGGQLSTFELALLYFKVAGLWSVADSTDEI